MMAVRKPYKSDLDDETYAFMLPYLLLRPEDAPQRIHPLREVVGALFYVARTGVQWDYLPHEFPPPETVRQQAQHWFEAGCFENMLHDLRVMVRLHQGRAQQPTAMILDSRTLQSTPESGARAGYNGGKRCKGTKIHMAVDTLGNLLTVLATPANEGDRASVVDLCVQAQDINGVSVEVAYVDTGYTGLETAVKAAEEGYVELVVVKRPEATQGFILLPKRWVRTGPEGEQAPRGGMAR